MTRNELPQDAGLIALVHLIATAKGCSFANVTYRAKGTGELAKHRLRVGVNMTNAYQKDIAYLQEQLPNYSGLHRLAAKQILDSLQESIERWEVGEYNTRYTNAETYIVSPIGLPGISVRRFNTDNGLAGEVSILGMTDGKTVIEPGEYKSRNSGALTLAKNEIRKYLRTDAIRRFCLHKVTRAALFGETLEIEGEP